MCGSVDTFLLVKPLGMQVLLKSHFLAAVFLLGSEDGIPWGGGVGYGCDVCRGEGGGWGEVCPPLSIQS